jgi:DNA-directed RNA polymerase specialized sigma24 family protein
LLPDEIVLQKKIRPIAGCFGEFASPRRREIITLKFLQVASLRNREIAIVLELDERTIASHLQRGLQDLNRKSGLNC